MTYRADLKQALIGGAKIWALREPALLNRATHWALVPSLALAVGLVLFLADWTNNTDFPRRFYSAGFETLFLVVALIGVIAWGVSRRLQNYAIDALGQTLAHLLAALLGYCLVFFVLTATLARDWPLIWSIRLFQAAFLVGVAMYVRACLEWVKQLPAPSWFGLAGLLVLLPAGLTLSLINRFDGDAFWYSAAPVASEPSFVQETVLLRQQAVLKQTLAELPVQRPGVTDLYFVSFAPDASEDVFKRETDVIQKVMNERFALQGRSLRLINHRSTTAVFPAATYGHLQAVLNHIGQQIDREEDILALYVTAHGAPDHRLSARLGGAQLINITPTLLLELLDKAKIKNRVLIVSACYSGGYINALKNDDSLVMTASAPNKTSFGCGNESDFTYFGKAIFDEQLRKTRSFERAFELALPVIAEREKLLPGVLPSEPQISVGANIRAKLKQLEQLPSTQIEKSAEFSATSNLPAGALVATVAAVAANGKPNAVKNANRAKKASKKKRTAKR
jgi:hypothetical protein